MLGHFEEYGGHADGNKPQRQVEPKRPAPAGAVREPAAQYRTKHGRNPKDRAHDAHVLAPLSGGDHIGDDRLSEDHESSAAQPLDGTTGDQHSHVRRKTTDDRPTEEQDKGADEEDLVPDQITEFAVDGRGEDVSGRHPQHVVDTAQIADDGR